MEIDGDSDGKSCRCDRFYYKALRVSAWLGILVEAPWKQHQFGVIEFLNRFFSPELTNNQNQSLLTVTLALFRIFPLNPKILLYEIRIS